jgi:hypothetical protein
VPVRTVLLILAFNAILSVIAVLTTPILGISDNCDDVIRTPDTVIPPLLPSTILPKLAESTDIKDTALIVLG